MATRFSILAWRIPWTEETGGLQSMGSQRVGHDLVTETVTKKEKFRCFFPKVCQHFLVVPLILAILVYIIGEGNGTPLQYSCLENPMDGGAW